MVASGEIFHLFPRWNASPISPLTSPLAPPPPPPCATLAPGVEFLAICLILIGAAALLRSAFPRLFLRIQTLIVPPALPRLLAKKIKHWRYAMEVRSGGGRTHGGLGTAGLHLPGRGQPRPGGIPGSIIPGGSSILPSWTTSAAGAVPLPGGARLLCPGQPGIGAGGSAAAAAAAMRGLEKKNSGQGSWEFLGAGQGGSSSGGSINHGMVTGTSPGGSMAASTAAVVRTPRSPYGPAGGGRIDIESGRGGQGGQEEGSLPGGAMAGSASAASLSSRSAAVRASGCGVHVYSNGDRYEGEFYQGKCSGSGIYLFSGSGGRYEGDWVDGKYDGYGIETWSRGSRYRGQYRKGLREGYGVYRFYTGDVYAGQWAKGQSHGVGVQTCADGSKYVGEFTWGSKHGVGKYTFR